ncbi:hypothetical protein ACJIZ3_006672 [Penstemon smallii]|uniref:FBD domain-containing protein n=1 Tax=Penstemon smallii TaxID=265156 RepID=A0ABD3S8I6_9LAMI
MRFRLKNISSVVRAYFEFYGIGDLRESDIYTSPESMVYLSQLFRSLQSVKELELGTLCTEVLSVLEMKGWKIPPDSARLCLTLNAFNHEGSIPGILGILKSSPYLETLVIEGEDYINYDEEGDLITRDPAVAYLTNGNLDLILNHLKTIKINSFTESVDGQPMLTLVRLLLKSAKVLEKMIVKDSIKCSSPKDATYLAKIASRLLTFPRASPEAVVMF